MTTKKTNKPMLNDSMSFSGHQVLGDLILQVSLRSNFANHPSVFHEFQYCLLVPSHDPGSPHLRKIKGNNILKFDHHHTLPPMEEVLCSCGSASSMKLDNCNTEQGFWAADLCGRPLDLSTKKVHGQWPGFQGRWGACVHTSRASPVTTLFWTNA